MPQTPAPSKPPFYSSFVGRSRAFTLIELLTVIAIIGILAAILIPTVGKVRSVARSSQSASNMRQIGLAMATYANDNKNATPSAQGGGRLDASGQPVSWFLQLALYFGADYTAVDKTRNALRILACPASLRSLSGETDVPWSGFNDSGWPFISDYGINYAVNNPLYKPTEGRMLTRFDSPRTPSRTPLLAEMVSQNNFVAATFAVPRPASDQAAFDGGQRQSFSQRHGGSLNMLFFDGHIKKLDYNALTALAGTTPQERFDFVEGKR